MLLAHANENSVQRVTQVAHVACAEASRQGNQYS